MMTGLDLFLDTVDDLRSRSGLRAAEYDVLQAAGLLRRLLMDKHPLYRLAANKFEKPTFAWNTVHVTTGRYLIAAHHSDPDVMSHINVDNATTLGDSPDVQKFGRAYVHELSIEQFLEQIVLVRHVGGEPWPPRVRENMVQVRDLIKHYSNRRGGVHWDVRPPDHALFAEALEDENAEYLLRQALAAAARVTVRALEPLAAQEFTQQQADETRKRFPTVH